jgi:hypothetical protein
VLHDIPPFVMASGNSAAAHGLNTEGLRRRGFGADSLAALRQAYKTLYRSGLTLQQARAALQGELDALVAASAVQPASAGIEVVSAQDRPSADREVSVGLSPTESLELLLGFLARVERGIVR